MSTGRRVGARQRSWVLGLGLYLLGIFIGAIDTGIVTPARTIIADDLGWKDVGFHGSDIRTPNIDQLAKTGAQLNQFYAQPMCTPTRAALMTGRYPFRYGLQTVVILSGQTHGLDTEEWLLPQALKEAGHQTAIIGKWHLGYPPHFGPLKSGYEEHLGPLSGGVSYFGHLDRSGKVDRAAVERQFGGLFGGQSPSAAPGVPQPIASGPVAPPDPNSPKITPPRNISTVASPSRKTMTDASPTVTRRIFPATKSEARPTITHCRAKIVAISCAYQSASI